MMRNFFSKLFHITTNIIERDYPVSSVSETNLENTSTTTVDDKDKDQKHSSDQALLAEVEDHSSSHLLSQREPHKVTSDELLLDPDPTIKVSRVHFRKKMNPSLEHKFQLPVTDTDESEDFDELDLVTPTDKLRVVKRGALTRQLTGPLIAIPPVATTDSAPAIYDLTVVTPTRNERDNVHALLEIVKKALTGINVEVIFVDDSDDDTPAVITAAQKSLNSATFHINLEHRPKGPERAGGLATAVDRGLRLAKAKYVAVIDADLQHPPAQLRVFYEEALRQDVDLVLASRYIKGGGYSGLDGFSRVFFSKGLKWTAKILFPEQLARVSDPLGGFFLLRRSLLDTIELRPIGYKILLEILIRSPWQSLAEVPYRFQARAHGQSKADMRQGIMALQHMGRLFREVPAAGRIWKCTALVLLNALSMLVLFLLTRFYPDAWQWLCIIAFTILACFNFFVCERFLFPAPPATTSINNPLPEAFEEIAEPFAPPPVASTLRIRALRHISMLLVLVAIGWICLTLPGAWVVVGALFVGFSIITNKRIATNNMVTMVLGMLVGIAGLDYLSWRFAVTNWTGWWIAIPLLFAETLGALHTLGFQYTLWPWGKPRLHLTDDPTRFPIFVFIPTVNEGPAILEPTVRGVLAARDRYLEKYPHAQITIVLCNDGYVAKAPDWEAVEVLAKNLGVTCVTRQVGGGAKAGNIEHARQLLQATDDALLVIFDADQVAKPEFFLKTIPAFGDPSLGWVQTGQYYSNLDNPVSRWADDQQSMFYNLLCPGKASLNAAFICGTNVVLRARALDEIGGLPQDSVTEDFSASIALHSHWRSVFLTDVLATGLGPLDMPSYLKQQRRWAIGTLGVLRTHWRDIFLPKKNGLSVPQRVQYFLACTHYLCGLRDLIYLLSPMLFILTGIPAVRGSTLSLFLWHFLPYWLASMAALWYAGRGITGVRGIVIGFGCFPVLIESLLSVVLQRKVGFSVTSKHRGKGQSLNYLITYFIFVVAGIACLILTTFAGPDQQASVFISGMWIVYSLCMLTSFLWLSFRDLRFQKTSNQELVTADKLAYPSRLAQRETSMRPVGNLVLALLIACIIFVGNGLHIDTSVAAPFSLSTTSTAQPLVGVAMPVQLLQNKRLPLLESTLDTRFSIVGRTQDVHDLFRRDWADQLASQHARPWITLDFGVYDAHGHAPVESSLPAIVNGLHDDDLHRWAQSLRDYGKPVYLTILLHVDRNWSLSSAVANGGIPQDVPRVWSHVQSIFHAEQARNVAWVWAPADPIHDQRYAPPSSSLDAVLLSMISYPGTQWADPDTTLQQLVARYPQKPIIVEVGVAGDQDQKVAWLNQVETAIDKYPHVHALIYHEGSPAINATDADNKQWSMLSDPSTEAAFQQIIQHLSQTKRPSPAALAQSAI